ncbi:MAG: pyridoxal-phosphate dependent enzyme [Rhizobiales bacterium]|nr:pyridoxal-phosphate dependent enzyme [Hyphomicrobiales bacterium]
MVDSLPGFNDVLDAAGRLAGHARATPVLRSHVLDEMVGAPVLVKAEVLQVIGAFKFRGAYNAACQVDRARFPGGVVACSSGNHAQGVAEAARRLGLAAAIVMPADAPAIKVRGVREAGATIVSYDRASEDREAITRELATSRKADLVHPFDDRRIICGQGTVGLELAREAASQGMELEHVLVPASGGGLVSGVAIAVHGLMPGAEVHSVEPAGFDRLARSLRSGRREVNERLSGSICDALMSSTCGELTFALAREHLSEGFAVSEDEVLAAMRFAFDRLKLVVEPGGAVGLAALLAGRVRPSGDGRAIGVVLSGGNVDPAMFARALA